MKIIKSLFSVLLIIIVFGCSNKKSIEIEIVSPVTLPDSLLSMYDIDSDNEHLYILDYDKFSLWKIKKNTFASKEIKLSKGRGPGEFYRIYQIAVNNNNIILYDVILRRVSFLDTTGKFLYSFNVPYGGGLAKMAVHKDTLYILCGDNDTKTLIHRYDLKGNKIDDIIEYFKVDSKLKHLTKDETKDIGQFFSPTGFCFQGDTIWLDNLYHYHIAAFYRGKKVSEIRGDDKFIRPPSISSKSRGESYSYALSAYGKTYLYYYKNMLIVDMAYLINSWNSKPRKFRYTKHIYSIPDLKLLAERTEIKESGQYKLPSIKDVLDGELYLERDNKLYRGDIVLR